MGNDTYPPHSWLKCGKGSRAAVPVFTCIPIDEGGTQLYPGDPDDYFAADFIVGQRPPLAGMAAGRSDTKSHRTCITHRPTSARFGVGST